MYARIAMYHGADAASIDKMLAERGGQIEADFDSPPPGMEGSRELFVLVDREGGRGMGITLFESEDAMRLGDRALESTVSMSQAGGVRTAVEFYEVALHRTRD
jgi:hypothetical protein